MKASALFSWPAELPFAEHFPLEAHPWEWLPAIARALQAHHWHPGRPLPPTVHTEGHVYVDPTARVAAFATIIGPAWIGPECEIRPGAYLRGNIIAGRGCVLGNSCEFKNCLLLGEVQVPHFSYVGDSILGRGVHLGAGVILSNLRLDHKPVTVRTHGGGAWETGLRKVGAFVGDQAEVGCNAVLQPGAMLGRRALVLPTVALAGHVPEGHIAHVRQRVEFIRRRD